jgi:hypothetical protein
LSCPTLLRAHRSVAAEPHEIVIRTNAPHTETAFQVVGAGGTETPLTRYGEARKRNAGSRIANWGARVLKPNETYVERFCLSREFDMSMASAYVVTASRSVPKTDMRRIFAGDAPLELRSEPMKIIVRDFAEEGRPAPTDVP